MDTISAWGVRSLHHFLTVLVVPTRTLPLQAAVVGNRKTDAHE
jgi:hypothetical protein